MAAAADFARSKRAMADALCKHLNLDPNTISNTIIEESDIASLFSHIVNSSQDEVMRWVEFSNNFVGNGGKQLVLLGNLNQDLSQRSVLLASGFKPSVADIAVFATVQVFVSHLSDSELKKYPHILRWMDYIQNIVDFGTTLQKINITKSVFDPPSHPNKADKGDADPSSKKAVSGQKIAGKSDGSADSKKAAENKSPEDKANPTSAKNNKPSGDKKKVQEKSAGNTKDGAAEKAPEKKQAPFPTKQGDLGVFWKLLETPGGRHLPPPMGSRPLSLSFKIVLLGDGRVGKTSLVLQYVNNVFSDKQEATVQASYLTKRLVVEGVPITLSIWDTAGQEKFHALGPIYYRDADAALLVYDITDSDTFVRVTKWVKELKQMANKDIVMAIAANKGDLVRSKNIDTQDATSYAESIGATLFVTSAKAGTGIDGVFSDIAKRLLEKRKNSADGLSPAHPKKGILIVEDEPDKEPPPKCCS